MVDTATQGVVNTIRRRKHASNLLGVAVTLDGLHAYVTNQGNNAVSVTRPRTLSSTPSRWELPGGVLLRETTKDPD